jgi:hypothetical protein
LLPAERNAIEFFDHRLGAGFEGLEIFLAPPVMEVADSRLALSAVIVEGVADFVADDRSDAPEVHAPGLL